MEAKAELDASRGSFEAAAWHLSSNNQGTLDSTAKRAIAQDTSTNAMARLFNIYGAIVAAASHQVSQTLLYSPQPAYTTSIQLSVNKAIQVFDRLFDQSFNKEGNFTDVARYTVFLSQLEEEVKTEHFAGLMRSCIGLDRHAAFHRPSSDLS